MRLKVKNDSFQSQPSNKKSWKIKIKNEEVKYFVREIRVNACGAIS